MKDLDYSILQKYKADNKLIESKHPTKDYSIYSYSIDTQVDRLWDDITLAARGVICKNNGSRLNAPFKKFFNYGEPGVPDFDRSEPVEYYEKLDGSLILLCYDGEEWIISTKGSFVTEQAKHAKVLLSKYNLSFLSPDLTYMFEIIYPANKIVVDYGSDDTIIMIGAQSLDYEYVDHSVYADIIGCPYVKGVVTTWGDMLDKFEDENKLEYRNKEGYVVRFINHNYRLKLKYDAYFKIHKVVTNITKKNVWEMLYLFGDVHTALGIFDIPDEFYSDFEEYAEELYGEYNKIYQKVLDFYMSDIFYNVWESKQEKYEYVLENIERKLVEPVVLMYQHKNSKLQEIIWKMVKPKGR